MSAMAQMRNHFTSTGDVSTQQLILKEVRKTNNRFDDMSKRLESMESHLSSVETTIGAATGCSSSADSCFEKAKKKIPPKVRVSFIMQIISICHYLSFLNSGFCFNLYSIKHFI